MAVSGIIETRDELNKAKQICAVMDMQGFNVGNTFYPRELAVVNNANKLCFEIDCEFDNEIIEENKGHFNYLRNHIHGIPINRVLNFNSSRVLLERNLKIILMNVYPFIKELEKKYIAVKNHYLAKILQEINIPYINLEKELIGNEIVPPLHLFDKSNTGFNYHCPLHLILNNRPSCNKQYRCSLRKCLNIWNWIDMKITSNSFFKMCAINDE